MWWTYARDKPLYIITLHAFIEIFGKEPTCKALLEGLEGNPFAHGLPKRKYLQRTEATAKFLRMMLKVGPVRAPEIVRPEYREGAFDCFHRGWIRIDSVDSKGFCVFASPIHFWYSAPRVPRHGTLLTVFRHCQALLVGNPACGITAPTPIAMVLDIVKLMKQPKPRPVRPEDWYYMGFYRASNTLDNGILWSPQFGKLGIKKVELLDFYLSTKKWALEFLHDENQLESYYGRFQANGNYHRWITDGMVLDWALVDFRTTLPTTPLPGKYKPPQPWSFSIHSQRSLRPYRLSESVPCVFLKRFHSGQGRK